MPEIHALAKKRLSINRITYFIGMGFLYIGLFSSTIADVGIGDAYILGTDAMAFLVFTIVLVLCMRGTIPFGIGVLICLAQTCLNFTLGSYIIDHLHTTRPMVGAANPQFLLLYGVFGVVAGIGISRWGAVLFGAMGLGTIYLFTMGMHNSWYYQHWFGLDVVIVSGCMTIVFYYRTMLENLVGRLDRSLREVHYLKDKAEELHEINKPFVVFGQNTAGLVQDFQNDVIVIGNELALLREQSDRESIGERLGIMTSAIRNLNSRIEWVKYVASATPQREQETLNIAQVINSAVYPFTLQPEFREKVEFAVSISNRLAIFGYRRWLLQVIENLIRISCKFQATTIKIYTETQTKQDSGLLLDLILTDNGLDFQERLNSKELANARLAAEQMDGQLQIRHEHATGFRACLSLQSAGFLDEV